MLRINVMWARMKGTMIQSKSKNKRESFREGKGEGDNADGKGNNQRKENATKVRIVNNGTEIIDQKITMWESVRVMNEL